jgi:superfamily I DNA/RNA helicase
VRDGDPVEHLRADDATLATAITSRVRSTGRAAVVLPDDRADRLGRVLTDADPRFGSGEVALDAPIAVLTARETKGLEFDQVFVVEPDEIGRQAVRGSDGYVACTRATQTLHLVALDPSAA